MYIVGERGDVGDKCAEVRADPFKEVGVPGLVADVGNCGGMAETGRKDSAHHSYQTFLGSVIRQIETTSSELLGR